MENVVSSWELLCQQAKRFGPYLLVEAVMPGGTLLAFLLYLYRSRKGIRATTTWTRTVATARTVFR